LDVDPEFLVKTAIPASLTLQNPMESRLLRVGEHVDRFTLRTDRKFMTAFHNLSVTRILSIRGCGIVFNPGDAVMVKKSRCGYTGPGVIIDQAYGVYFLVRIEDNQYRPIILVRMTDLSHQKSGRREKK
jgi:hypothetical protein